MLLNEVKSYGYLERNITQSFKISDEWLFLPWNKIPSSFNRQTPPEKKISVGDVF